MATEFLEKYNGVLKGVLRWEKLDELWSNIRSLQDKGWYIYAPGHDIPEKVADGNDVDHFLTRMDKLLREESGLPITVTDDPLSTVALGSGKALDTIEILKQVVIY